MVTLMPLLSAVVSPERVLKLFNVECCDGGDEVMYCVDFLDEDGCIVEAYVRMRA